MCLKLPLLIVPLCNGVLMFTKIQYVLISVKIVKSNKHFILRPTCMCSISLVSVIEAVFSVMYDLRPKKQLII
jgi:hypothetical protein